MATEFTVTVHDRPGAAADVAEAVATAGVNIDGVCCVISAGRAQMHLLAEDAAKAREALDARGIGIDNEREVLVVDVQDRPGVLAEITRAAADAGINLTTLYLATNTRLVLGADDLNALRRAL